MPQHPHRYGLLRILDDLRPLLQQDRRILRQQPHQLLAPSGQQIGPLRQSLRRCQQLGEAAVNDPGCLATWAENRDRFLGRTPVPAAPHQNGGE